MSKSNLLPGAWMALSLLFIVSIFNYVDRFVLSVLLPSIKQDLALSDTQLGAIATAFTLSYVLLGIPLARFADRHSRKIIISVSLAVWSAMTAASGLAQNFTQLVVARIFVGVGEAGATPPSHSLISDFFPQGMRTKAIAVYGIGAPVGIIVGFILASWLAEQYSWRVAFFALGIPGILFAIFPYVLIKEPQRGHSEEGDRGAEANEIPTLLVTVKVLLSSPSYRHLSIATGLYTVVYLAVISWLPSYFIRSFDMELSQIGFWLAMSLGVSQLIGMLSCGAVTDVLIKYNKQWYCWLPALAMFISTPLLAIVFATNNGVLAALVLAPAFMIGVFQGPASFAAIQAISHLRMRAMAVAIFLLIVNLIGGSIGPLFTGWLSDQFVSLYGQESLKWALMIVSILFGLWAGVHYLLAGKTIAQEIDSPRR